ncbi:MAG: hypothetical protein ACRDRL_23030 [Sciscionella sp.]
MVKMAVILWLALPCLRLRSGRTPAASPALLRFGARVAVLLTRASRDIRECLGPPAGSLYIAVDPLHPNSVSAHLDEPVYWPDPTFSGVRTMR